jgi:hypothetical protein
MTETASQPDVTRLQLETGFSSSRDRVGIHARKKTDCCRGGFSSAAPNSISSKSAAISTPICAGTAPMTATRSKPFCGLAKRFSNAWRRRTRPRDFSFYQTRMLHLVAGCQD